MDEFVNSHFKHFRNFANVHEFQKDGMNFIFFTFF